MSSERYRDGSGWQEKAGYSRALRRGDHIYVSGTTANATDGIIDQGVGEQTAVALTQAIAAVEALGGSMEDIVRTRLLLAPGADWEAAAGAHRDILGHVAPANTMVFVHSLVGDGFLVEVEVEAVLGS
jgi:enamine deaminase RidA (YjgF/YER057c/UK114 family)